MATFQDRRPDLLPLRLILWETLGHLMGRKLPTVDRLPTHEPNRSGWYLGYEYGMAIEVFHISDIYVPSQFEWRLGWIYLGCHPTLIHVMISMANTYMECRGELWDEALLATLISGLHNWPGSFIMSDWDAFIFGGRDDGVSLAKAEADGTFWDSDGFQVTGKWGFGVPLKMYKEKK